MEDKKEPVSSLDVLTTDVILSDAYGYSYRRIKKELDNLFSKVKEIDREKAKLLLDDCLNYGVFDIVDLCHEFLANVVELEYLEFNPSEEIEKEVPEPRATKNILLAINAGENDITMEEVEKYMRSSAKSMGLDLEKNEKFGWLSVLRSPVGFCRALVQFSDKN